MAPELSKFFEEKQPSSIRLAQLLFLERQKKEGKKAPYVINVAIGNVSLKTHPKMLKRYLKPIDKELKQGIWKYSLTFGREICNNVFVNIIKSFLDDSNDPKLYSLIGDGSSVLMKLTILGVCGNPGKDEKPLLLIDPAYANYSSIANETGRKIVAVSRTLNSTGKFSDVSPKEIENAIIKHKPGALLIIPYDNPSGQLMKQEVINEYARLCLKYNIFLVSDEAYRGLYYTKEKNAPSVWQITNKEVPGIENAKIRISLETMSKVFNACGLRMGALVTDNKEFHTKAVFASTTYLCASVTSQHIVESLIDESKSDIQSWVKKQRDYYRNIFDDMYVQFKKLMPNLIVSVPEAAIYLVLDVKNIAKHNFDSEHFVKYCAEKGSVKINNKQMTLLVAPMTGFYNTKNNPGKTQMRIACVLPKNEMKLVPKLFKELFKQYESKRP
ncbi:MAG: aminotransferase class I/II-fold pyridoxal phosphate-dependent enzyme [Candidatus Nanoarchaeia archaeon]|nr:aminotransferase class I/II-fold pyridoxal phosphate-dependent enzyme [Candidatus Nanoarchaeia archaeon]